jgi:hypothetical protein
MRLDMTQTKKTFFCERTDTPSETIYRFKKRGLPMALCWGGFIFYLPTLGFHLLPLWVMFAYLAVAVPYIAIAILYHLRPNAELRRAARHGRLRMEGDRMIIQREVTHAS